LRFCSFSRRERFSSFSYYFFSYSRIIYICRFFYNICIILWSARSNKESKKNN